MQITEPTAFLIEGHNLEFDEPDCPVLLVDLVTKTKLMHAKSAGLKYIGYVIII